MVTEFDIRDFLANCKASKPPYQCLYDSCGKTYKSLTGIQQHVNTSHLNDLNNKKKIFSNKRNPMFYDDELSNQNSLNNVGKTRETLTYAEAQRMIEVEIEGVIHRIKINEPMDIVCLDPESNINDKNLLESYQTPEIYSNHNDTFCKINSLNNHVTSKKSTKRGRSKSKDCLQKSKNSVSSSNQSLQIVKLPEPSYRLISNRSTIKAPPRPISYFRYIDKSIEELDETVEYDMDEEDFSWLELINKKREKDNLTLIPPDTFELLMDRLEKECYFLNESNGNGDCYNSPTIDDDAVCCICSDGECQNSNAILFCDMCDLPVHQECYGVPYIPEGQWLCRRCLQSPSRGVSCILCPNKGGAFKQTDDGRWCHVVCALWIPEVCFANTVFLEPIDNITAIPTARWRLVCYICKQKNTGACIQCHKGNCYTAFHVTCAQQAGLHMRMEAVREYDPSKGLNTYIRKEAYCYAHVPEDGQNINNNISNNNSNNNHHHNHHNHNQNNHNKLNENNAETDCSFSDEDSELNVKLKKKSKKNQKSNTFKENNSFDDASLTQKRQIKEKMKKARKILAEKRKACPTISIPTIPAERLTEIAQLINIPKRNQFVQRLLGYWTLKRESRNGVPLLRRLQVSNCSSRRTIKNNSKEHNDEQTIQLKAELHEMHKLRQDLERARILIELIRKREKLKREKIRNLEQITHLQLNPFNVFLDSVLNILKSKDTNGFFLEPVDTEEVHDYLIFIKKPMSFLDMKKKLDNFEYSSFDEFEQDFYQIIENCTIYNLKQTIFYKAAIKLRDQCKSILAQARSGINEIGYDQKKGIHCPEVLTEQPSPFTQFIKYDRKEELESKLSQLNEQLFQTKLKKSGGTKSKKLRFLNAEIEKINKELACIDGSFQSFIEKNDNPDKTSNMNSFNANNNITFETESLQKISKQSKSRMQQKFSNDNLLNKEEIKKKTSESYTSFELKNRKQDKSIINLKVNNQSKKRNDNKANKNKKLNELNIKPITSYLPVLQNSDSFKVYRSNDKSDESDESEQNSESSVSSLNSSNSSFSSSSSNCSLVNNNHENKHNFSEQEVDKKKQFQHEENDEEEKEVEEEEEEEEDLEEDDDEDDDDEEDEKHINKEEQIDSGSDYSEDKIKIKKFRKR